MVKEKRKKSKRATKKVALARTETTDAAEKQEKGSKGTQSGLPSKKKLDLRRNMLFGKNNTRRVTTQELWNSQQT